jgi:general secretion pathway protein K
VKTRRSERGAALIVVLWSLALVGIAAVAITLVTHSQAATARNAVANAEARLAAEGGLQLALRRMLAGAASGSRFDGTPFVWRSGRFTVTIAIRDEEGKIDLNLAPVEVLHGLMLRAGAAPAEALSLACRIVERRGFRSPLCPEEPLRLPEPVGSFVAVEELRHLSGMTDEVYGRVAPHVTVYSGAAQLDPTVASREALLAVPSLSEGSVEQLLVSRSLGGGDTGDLLSDRRWFVRSSRQTFTLTAEAASAGGAGHRVEAVVRLAPRPDRPYVVLAWREPPSGW